MKIRKLQLKNIGVFDDETIEFQSCPEGKAEIHILTGQNGSGKSTILMALASVFADFSKDDIYLTTSLDNGKAVQINAFWGELSNLFHKRFKHYKNSVAIIYCDNVLNTEYSAQLKNAALKKSPTQYFNYGVFAYSSYRRIKNEKIEFNQQVEENPFYQSLDFVKDEDYRFTINQWLGRNLARRALANEASISSQFNYFNENIESFEEILSDIIGQKIKFRLTTDLSLVLIKDDQELDFDVLPDGLKSLISWIGDLLSRIDLLKWEGNKLAVDREIILFLDEIEVHLHPAWQRKVLPVVQKLFKNSQIFVSTHSPFVVNSVDDAWVYKLELEDGKAKVGEIIKSEDAWSYSRVLSEIFDIKEEFGIGVNQDLTKFKELRNKIIAGKNGSDKTQKEFLKLAKSLAVQSEELQTIVQFELRQINKRTGKNLVI